jgi:hypothetical protein
MAGEDWLAAEGGFTCAQCHAFATSSLDIEHKSGCPFRVQRTETPRRVEVEGEGDLVQPCATCGKPAPKLFGTTVTPLQCAECVFNAYLDTQPWRRQARPVAQVDPMSTGAGIVADLREMARMAQVEGDHQTAHARIHHCEGEVHAYRDAASRVERWLREQRRESDRNDAAFKLAQRSNVTGWNEAIEAAARVAEKDPDKDEWSPRDIARAIRALVTADCASAAESDEHGTCLRCDAPAIQDDPRRCAYHQARLHLENADGTYPLPTKGTADSSGPVTSFEGLEIQGETDVLLYIRVPKKRWQAFQEWERTAKDRSR